MPALVLASTSPTRRRILENAGLAFETASPGVDEEEVKLSLKASGATGAQIAETLAELKANRVSARRPEALVIGADQILSCNGVLFDKPPDMDHARAQLQALRGKPHELLTAICVAKAGGRVWHHNAVARLTMRPFSDAFLDDYLARAGQDVLGSVGVYRLEGLGAQLFSRIDGDFFTILGLPLLPLLGFLRENGIGRI
ncbi:MAG: nucleoside triphosphate pyrophosphatase [Reyranellaceae bacterium]